MVSTVQPAQPTPMTWLKTKGSLQTPCHKPSPKSPFCNFCRFDFNHPQMVVVYGVGDGLYHPLFLLIISNYYNPSSIIIILTMVTHLSLFFLSFFFFWGGGSILLLLLIISYCYSKRKWVYHSTGLHLPKKPWRISTDPSPQRTDASTAGDATWPPFGARLPDLGNPWGRWAHPKTSENYGMGTPKRS